MAEAQSIGVENFLELAETVPLFDVRTPSEFANGHIPGARNLPLFSDEERARVGTTYNREGSREAILTGLELVGPKMRAMVEAVEAQTSQRRVLLHCWRGGMRSRSVAWLLSFSGFEVTVLQGGYKAYRQHVLSRFALRRQVFILSGYTGSGKTEILGHLREMGEQVIDLEGLAHHKGSAFGALGELPQPTQQQFENELARQWEMLDPERPVWLEDESKKIGWRVIPAPLWEQMRHTPVYFLDMPVERRVERLVADYGDASPDQLAACVSRLSKRVGGQNTQQALEALAAGDLATCTDILLRRYYDKAYLHGLSKRDQTLVHHVPTQTADARENAQCLMVNALKRPDTSSGLVEGTAVEERRKSGL